MKRYALADLEQLAKEGDFLPTRSNAPVLEPDPAFWRDAVVRMPGATKASVHLRIDADVLEWFKSQGKDHLSRMNAVLHSYMEAHLKR